MDGFKVGFTSSFQRKEGQEKKKRRRKEEEEARKEKKRREEASKEKKQEKKKKKKKEKRKGKQTKNLDFFVFSLLFGYLCGQQDNQECRVGCNKTFRGHPTLTSGILTMLCPHGIILGFSVMAGHESCEFPFKVLQTRFSKGLASFISNVDFGKVSKTK